MKEIKLDPIYDSIILLSDVHFGVHVNSIEWNENILNYFNNFFVPYVKEYKKNHTPILIIAGDFFEDRTLLDIGVMNDGINVIDELSKILPVHFIVGNHDIYKKNDCDINSLVVHKYMNNVTIHEKPTVLSIRDYKIELVPWIGDFKKESSHVMNSESDVLIMHTEIKGFSYDRGQTIINGTEVGSFKGKMIFSGHIHKRQELKKVTYLGSPYATSRSDIGNEKGIYALELYDKINVSFKVNDYSPKFIQCDVSEIYGKDKNVIEGIIGNNYVDVTCKKSDNKNLSKLIEEAEGCGFKKLELKYVKEEVVENKDVRTADVNKGIEVLIEDKIKSLKEKGLAKKQITYLLTKNSKYIKSIN